MAASRTRTVWTVVIIIVVAILVIVGIGAFMLLRPKGTVTEECTSRYFTSTDVEAGFHELLDAKEQQTWGTQDVSEEQWNALTLPWDWSLWIKNTPRELMSLGVFLRSPGCPEDGQFRWKSMYDADWLNVADFTDMNTPVDPDGLISSTTMHKFHRLTYDAGSPVWVLTSPKGERYLIVTRDFERTTDTPTLPEGWSISDVITLTKPLTYDLMGDEIANLRVSNGDSFQGPMPADLNLQDYAQ